MRRLLALLTVVAFAGGCETDRSLSKGGLVPLSVDARELNQAYAARRWALVIGISDFDDDRWRDLRFARKDAEDFAATLLDGKRGKFDDVTVLTGPERTTRAAVLDAIGELRDRSLRPDDVLIVYISAHGTLARDHKGELDRYLVTSDARYADIPGTALSIDRLKEEFDRLGSKRRLLVLATCHSGSGKSLLPPEVAEELASLKSGAVLRPLEEASRATMVFAACDWGETAREDEGLKNDIYTHFLVAGLSGEADRNGDGAVTATEAHDFARRRTFSFTGGRQRPSAEILEVGADPVVLSGSFLRAGNPELYSYTPRLDQFILKVDGEERAELPGGAAVPAGKRRVELTKGGRVLLSRDLELSQGDRLDLDELLRQSQPHRTVSLLGGALGFVDARTRSEVLPAAPAIGLSLQWNDLPVRHVSLLGDLALTRGRHALRLDPSSPPLPFDYGLVSFGVAAAYQHQVDRLGLFVGPRVSMLLLERRFELQGYAGAQHYSTVTPGVVAGASFELSERLELSARGQLSLAYLVVDGQGQALAFGAAWAGVGYRF